MAGGRPLKFKTVDELQDKINKYFASCYEERWIQNPETQQWSPVLDRNGKVKMDLVHPFTITGLALALDTSRETLLDYAEKEKYSDTIKKAKDVIHNYTEEQLLMRDKPTGVIFNLKNNWGWRDKSETEVSGKDGDSLKIKVTVNNADD